MIEEIDEALEKIYTENFMYSYQLFEKYYGDREYAMPTLTKEEKEIFAKYATIRVGYGEDYAPIQYTDSEGAAAGISIDLFNIVAQKAGVSVIYVPLERGQLYTTEDIDLSLSFTQG